uniref:Putative monoacylglycerol lipase abhd12 n=1 Tax=Anopheles aquasalis TaxID=42839 RepID=T1DP31_ANOAQ
MVFPFSVPRVSLFLSLCLYATLFSTQIPFTCIRSFIIKNLFAHLSKNHVPVVVDVDFSFSFYPRCTIFSRIGLRTCQFALLVFLIVFVVMPIIFKFSFAMQKSILFLTFISYPPNLDLKRPEKSGLYATRNFYINYRDQEEDLGVDIAVWHVLPNDLVRRYAKELHVDENTIPNTTISTEEPSIARGGSIIASDGADNQTDQQLEQRYRPIEQILRADGFNPSDEHHQKELFEASLRATTNDVVLYLHGNTASRGATHRVELYKNATVAQLSRDRDGLPGLR